ncbi:MAG: hypothetical protein VKK04_07650 [Synechococcales bacterium]|nr:hypothetical protein [Synechococcales bacterium]
MKAVATLLIALIFAGWIVAIAILSIQNVFIPDGDGGSQLVVLSFLGAQSIALPFGIVLAFSVALGALGTAILLPFVLPTSRRSPREDWEDEL